MMIHFTGGLHLFQPQMRHPGAPSLTGLPQNPSLQKVVQQVNEAYGSKRSRDTVELSQASLELLEAAKVKKPEEAKQPQAVPGYQKYPAGMFTKEEWAENALSEQRNGIKSASDVIDYAKAKLRFTMSKMEELENYLHGTGTHSDPAMTKALAETYLHNYKQSIQSDYQTFLEDHVGPGLHQQLFQEYDSLSGGLASQATENQLAFLNADSLGLSNLSDDPREMMAALENASKILSGLNQKVEQAYAQMTGGKSFAEPASSTSLFDGHSSLHFFASRMEQAHRIVDSPLRFHDSALRLD